MTLIQNPLHNLEGYLRSLCISIGERPTGSRKNRLATEFVGDLFARRGYAVEYLEFDCLDWRAGSVSLACGEQEIPTQISPYSLPCQVSASFEPLGDLPSLQAASLEGKIAVLYGDLTRAAILPKKFPFYSSEEHQTIIRTLEAKSPLAVITASFCEERLAPVIEDGDFNFPCVVVSNASIEKLISCEMKAISLHIEASRQPARGANVIARRKNPAAHRKMVLTAHLDTKPGTPGALDNASGVATLLALSPLVTTRFLDFELEFAVLNGEDYYSNPGQVAYLNSNQADLERVFLAINVDGVGLKDSPTGVSYLEMPGQLQSTLDAARQVFHDIEEIPSWQQGDHMLFVMNGVPALTLTSSRIFELVDRVIHTPHDTYDLLDLPTIWQAALYLSEVLSRVNQ